jgi:OFA family oxalate/formate antiporter-like MFS transporter
MLRHRFQESSPLTDSHNMTGTLRVPDSPYRYLVLMAAVAMQACLGATYAWSVIVKFLREVTDLGQGDAQTPFTVFYIVFPATTVFAGRLLERIGPRRCALLGATAFGAGWIVAGFGKFHFALTVLGVGVLGGLGVGFAYLVPIAVGMRWFPNRRGLVTGVAVAGFGGGAALVSQVAQYLMDDCAMDPFNGLRFLGVAFLLLALPAAGVMAYPATARESASDTSAPTGFVRQREFLLLYVAMFAGLAAGFTVNANLVQLNPGLGDLGRTGATAVAAFAIANAIGRVCWGAIADRFQGNSTIRANLVAQAAVLATHGWLLDSSGGLLLLAAITGFNYGGVLVLYAASAGRIWGTRNVGRVYGALFSANCPAALAPLLAGAVFDATHSFAGPLYGIAAGLVVAALIVRDRGSADDLGNNRR